MYERLNFKHRENGYKKLSSHKNIKVNLFQNAFLFFIYSFEFHSKKKQQNYLNSKNSTKEKNGSTMNYFYYLKSNYHDLNCERSKKRKKIQNVYALCVYYAFFNVWIFCLFRNEF